MKRLVFLLVFLVGFVNLGLSVEQSRTNKQVVVKEQKVTKNNFLNKPLKLKKQLSNNNDYLLLGVVLILLGTIYLVAPAVFGFLFIAAGIMFLIMGLMSQGVL